jgi:hypothetical protein
MEDPSRYKIYGSDQVVASGDFPGVGGATRLRRCHCRVYARSMGSCREIYRAAHSRAHRIIGV